MVINSQQNLNILKLVEKFQPLVSVIMPTYNHAKFIGEAIRSVLRQSYKNLELIIINNFSTDNTEGIIRSFTDKRINYFKFANHGIIAASRNFGIMKAYGEYIAFIDSDDIWFPNKLNTQLEFLRENPDVVLVCCSLKIKSPDNRRYDSRITFAKSRSQSGYLHRQLLNFNFIAFSTVILKSSVLKDVGYFDENQEIVPAEDWDLWLRIAQRYQITFIPKAIGIYRMHSSNFSMNVKKLSKALYVVEKHLKKGWIDQRQANMARASLYFHEGWFSIDKDVKMSRSLFYKSLLNNNGNLNIYFFSILGLFLSLFPFVCTFIKKKSLDKKVGGKLLSLQNL